MSHATAAKLWNFPGIEADAIDVLVDLDRRVRMTGVRSHRSSALFTAEIVACVLAAFGESGQFGAA